MDLLSASSLETLLPVLLLLGVAGGLIGLLAGLFGVGGGAISVPVFFEVFRLAGVIDSDAMPLAVGTSLAMIVPTALLSTREHARRGAVDFALLRTWALPMLAGVVCGAVLARDAAPALFQGVFVAVALVNATKLLAGNPRWLLRETLPGRATMAALGALIGLLSALMGIGGGALSTMILTVHGRPIHAAVATSAGVGVLIAVPGTLGYIAAGWGRPGLPPDAVGFVSLAALALTMPTALLTTRMGVRLAHALSKQTLSRLFGAFLLLVAARFAVALAL